MLLLVFSGMAVQSMTSAGNDFIGLIRRSKSGVDLQASRRQLDELTRVTGEFMYKLVEVVGTSSASFVGSIERRSEAEIERYLAELRSWESEEVARGEEYRKEADIALKQLGRTDPLVTPLVNDAKNSYSEMIDRVAEAYRDARWSVMEARAARRPSAGVGAVKGKTTDLDAFLKSQG